MQKTTPLGRARIRFRYQRLIWSVTLVAGLIGVSGLAAETAGAIRLKAKVYIVKEKVPRGLGDKELVAFARKNQVKQIEESGKGAVKERRWRAYVVVVFNAPPGRLEYEMAFYDVQKGLRILVERHSILLSSSDEKNYVQRLVLKRPKYKPNRRMELVVAVGGQEVGRVKFKLVGEEAAKGSGSAP